VTTVYAHPIQAHCPHQTAGLCAGCSFLLARMLENVPAFERAAELGATARIAKEQTG